MTNLDQLTPEQKRALAKRLMAKKQAMAAPTLLERLRHWAQQTPNAFATGERTYAALLEQAQGRAKAWQSRGLQKGARVLLLHNAAHDWLLDWIACLLCDATCLTAIPGFEAVSEHALKAHWRVEEDSEDIEPVPGVKAEESASKGWCLWDGLKTYAWSHVLLARQLKFLASFHPNKPAVMRYSSHHPLQNLVCLYLGGQLCVDPEAVTLAFAETLGAEHADFRLASSNLASDAMVLTHPACGVGFAEQDGAVLLPAGTSFDVVDDQGKPVADRMTGQLRFKVEDQIIDSGYRVRRQGKGLKCLQNTQLIHHSGVAIHRSFLAQRIEAAGLRAHHFNVHQKRLEVFAVTAPGMDVGKVEASLKGALPQWMMPILIPISQIPRDPAGYVDCAALERVMYVTPAERHRHTDQHRAVIATPYFPQPSSIFWRPSAARAQAEPNEKPQSDTPAYAKGASLKRALPQNLGDVLTAAMTNEKAGITHINRAGNESFQSYGELHQAALRVLAGFEAAGIEVGQPVMVIADDSSSYFATLWACFLGGRVAVPAAIPKALEADHLDMRKLDHAHETLAHPPVVCRQALRLQLAQANLWQTSPRFLEYESLLDHAPSSARETDHTSPAIMFLTSGSTGIPKLVQQGHGQLLAMAAGTVEMNAFDASFTAINWMPLDHVGAVAFLHLTPLFARANQLQVSTTWIMQDPVRWLEAIETHRVAVAWAPNFAYGLLNGMRDAIHQRVKDLSSMVFLVNAGEANVGRVMATFHTMLKPLGLPQDAIRPAFGMSETCSGITWSRGFDPEREGDAPYISLGPPIPGAEVRIVDAQDNLLNEPQVGRMQLRGASVTPGYFNNAAKNAEVFSEGGWFDTGDQGYLQDGELVLTGREKDEIIVNGANFAAHDLEAHLEGSVALTPSFTAIVQTSQPEKLLVFCVPQETQQGEQLFNEVRNAMLQHAGIAPDAVVMLQEADIPKTGIGKIQRATLRDQFRAGDFAAQSFGAQHDQSLPRWFYEPTWQQIRLLSGEAVERDWWQPGQPVKLESEHCVVDLRTLDLSLELALDALVSLANEAKQLKRVDLITKHAFAVQGSVAEPTASGISAWFAAWQLEAEHLRLRHLDVDHLASHQEIEGWLNAVDLNAPMVLRNGTFFERKLQSTALGVEKRFWQPSGTYVVAGGAGGIGLALTQHLIAQGCKVVVLGRRSPQALPTDWLVKPSLTYYQVDICDEHELGQVLGSLDQIHGIFQLAGQVTPQPIGEIKQAAIREQLAARLHGTRHLLENAESQAVPLIAFGSVTGFFGFAGVSVYAAANAAMAALLSRSEQGYFYEWSVWSEDGLNAGNAVEHLHDRHGFIPVATETGLRSLDYLLAHAARRSLVGLDEGHPWIRQQLAVHAVDGQRLIACCEGAADDLTVKDWRDRDVVISAQQVTLPRTADNTIDLHELLDHQRPAASASRYQAPTNALEEVIAQAWCDILEQRRIGIDDHFFDVGGHSLQATRVMGRLSQYFRIEFPVRHLFSAPTIRQLAKRLRETEPKPGQLQKTIEIRRKIEAMKTEEGKS